MTEDEPTHIASNIERMHCQQPSHPTFVRPEAHLDAYDQGYDHGLPFNFDIDIKEVCNGIVDPQHKEDAHQVSQDDRSVGTT